MTTPVPIPKDLWDKMLAFLHEQKTGQFVLDVKSGEIAAWKITEAGRTHVDRGQAVDIR